MRIVGEKIRWIDILRPADKDLAWLKNNFNLHPILIDELKGASVRAKVESFGGYLYLIYHFPVYDPAEKVSRKIEIDFIITKKEVITVRYDDVSAFSDFQKSLADPKLAKEALRGTLDLTHRLIAHLIAFNERQLNHIREKVDAVSLQLFKDKERELLEQISYLKRDLSEYCLIAKPQQHLFNSLLESGVEFWGKSSRAYLADLLGDYLKLLHRLDSYREAVSDFEATNNQMMEVKTNEIMKTFTVLAFSTFPLMFIAALFTMRTQGIPLIDQPYGFWAVLALMGVVVIAMVLFFRLRRLL